jgi:hypothetical protein
LHEAETVSIVIGASEVLVSITVPTPGVFGIRNPKSTTFGSARSGGATPSTDRPRAAAESGRALCGRVEAGGLPCTIAKETTATRALALIEGTMRRAYSPTTTNNEG